MNTSLTLARSWNQSDDKSQAESVSESKESTIANNTNELPANNN
jgi:hypothetical protein